MPEKKYYLLYGLDVYKRLQRDSKHDSQKDMEMTSTDIM
jgi:hypothetical protein